MTAWIIEYFMTAPIVHEDALASLGLSLDPDTGGINTFSTILTTDGNAPSADNRPHLASVFPATVRIHNMIVCMNLLGQGLIDANLETVRTYMANFSDTPHSDAVTILSFVAQQSVQAMMFDLLWWRVSAVENENFAKRELQAKKVGIEHGTVGEVVNPADCWASLGLYRYVEY